MDFGLLYVMGWVFDASRYMSGEVEIMGVGEELALFVPEVGV